MYNFLPNTPFTFSDLPALACKRSIIPIPTMIPQSHSIPLTFRTLLAQNLPQTQLHSFPSKLHGFHISSQEQQIIVKPKTMRKLSKTCKPMRDSAKDGSSITFYSPFLAPRDLQMASDLNIILANPTNSDIKTLSSFLTRPNNLKTLKLSINFKHISNPTAHCLFYNLRNLNELQNLTFDFQGCSNLQDKSIKTLSMSLKSFSCLLSLKINFIDAKNLTNKSASYLATNFRYLKSLLSLDINFNSWNITDPAVETLITGLNRLDNIVDLALNFQFRKITGSGLKLSLQTLKTLNLNLFGCTEINEEGLKMIAFGLGNLKSLEQIHLNFGLCKQISDQQVKALGQSLQQLPNLYSLHVDFEACIEITANGVEEITKLSHLEILNINLSGCTEIAKPDFRAFSSGLKSLNSLKELTLDFFGCSSFSDEALQAFSEGLTNKASLKKLDIVLPAPSVTDQGVQKLAESLGTMRSLNNFSLGFGGNFRNLPQITDKSIESLSKNLKGLTNLSDLFLCFNFCRNISNQGLVTLSGSLKGLSSLKMLKYNFFCGLHIGENEKEILMRVNTPQMILNHWK